MSRVCTLPFRNDKCIVLCLAFSRNINPTGLYFFFNQYAYSVTSIMLYADNLSSKKTFTQKKPDRSA